VEYVQELVFTPDSKKLVANFFPGGILNRMWDLSGAEPRELTNPVTEYTGAPVSSPDSKTLALITGIGPIILLDMSGADPRRGLTLNVPWYGPVAFTPDGKELITASSLGLSIWDVTGTEAKVRVEASGHKGGVTAVLSPNNKTLATFGADTAIRLFDMTSAAPTLRTEITRHQGQPISVAFSPDSKSLATVISDKAGTPTLHLWDIGTKDPDELARVKVSWNACSAQFSPDGKTLFVADYADNKHMIRRWTVRGAELKEQPSLPNCYGPVNVSPDGKLLACRHPRPDQNGFTGCLWDLSGPEPKEDSFIPRFGDKDMWHLALSADGKSLAGIFSSGDICRFLVWDMTGGKFEEKLFLDYGAANIYGWSALAFSPDGKTLAAAGAEGIVLWDLGKARRLKGWKQPDGKFDMDFVHELSRKVQTTIKFPGAVTGIAFSGDCRYMVTSNPNGTAYVLRVAGKP
jgi:WD40 repeat protein